MDIRENSWKFVLKKHPQRKQLESIAEVNKLFTLHFSLFT